MKKNIPNDSNDNAGEVPAVDLIENSEDSNGHTDDVSMGGNNPPELIEAAVHTDETLVEGVETNAIESFDREEDGFGRRVLPARPVELSSSPVAVPSHSPVESLPLTIDWFTKRTSSTRPTSN